MGNQIGEWHRPGGDVAATTTRVMDPFRAVLGCLLPTVFIGYALLYTDFYYISAAYTFPPPFFYQHWCQLTVSTLMFVLSGSARSTCGS